MSLLLLFQSSARVVIIVTPSGEPGGTAIYAGGRRLVTYEGAPATVAYPARRVAPYGGIT